MALDTFNPYLFVSAGEQSNKFLTPTYADGVASFQAQRAQELAGLTVRIDPVQEGTGDPSPTNIRPISGRTGLTVTRMGNILGNVKWVDNFVINAQGVISTNNGLRYSSLVPVVIGESYAFLYDNIAGTNYNTRIHGYDSTGAWVQQIVVSSTGNNTGRFRADFTIPSGISFIRVSTGMESGIHAIALGALTNYPVTWQTEAGTVYGGTLDVVSGVLTVDWDYIASYDGETLPGEWISDRDVYEEGTTPTTGAEVAYKLAEPVTYQLTPTDVKTLAGFNQIYSDAGPVIGIKF